MKLPRRTSLPALMWLVAAAVLAAILGAGRVIDVYGGGSYWPQLAAGFAASLGAFMLALSWESLARVGNLSSASVVLILEQTLLRRRPEAGALGVMLAMGPAFCSELLLLRW